MEFQTLRQFAFNKDLPLNSPELPGGAPRFLPLWARMETFARISHYVLILYCLVAAISIGISQTLLIPLIFYWLLLCLRNGVSGLEASISSTAMARPVLAWFLVCFLSGLWGANVSHSLIETLKSSIFLAFPFVVCSSLLWAKPSHKGLLFRCLQYAAAFLAGQTIAGIHTLLSVGTSFSIWDKIPGAVTESGQLVLALPLLVGICLAGRQMTPEISSPEFRKSVVSASLRSGAAGLLVLLAWPFHASEWSNSLSSSEKLIAICSSMTGILFLITPLFYSLRVFFGYLFRAKPIHWSSKTALYTASAVILADAFILNLKRGPWFGAFVQLLIFGLIYSKRILPAFLAGIFLIFCFISPVRTRLLDSKNHFLIEGGRQSMWALGGELVQAYPLGIGFANSRLMRVLDPTLPKSHRHMHNNLLQVTVETGWLGLGVYLWWMGSVLSLAFRGWRENHYSSKAHEKALSYIFATLGIALLGWQCAGIVEYNFGDSEIRIIALFFMGMLIAMKKLVEQSKPATKN